LVGSACPPVVDIAFPAVKNSRAFTIPLFIAFQRNINSSSSKSRTVNPAKRVTSAGCSLECPHFKYFDI
jgi:hypothetical protein